MIALVDRAHYAITIPGHDLYGVERKNTLGQFKASDQTFRVVVGLDEVFVPRDAVIVVQRLPT